MVGGFDAFGRWIDLFDCKMAEYYISQECKILLVRKLFWKSYIVKIVGSIGVGGELWIGSEGKRAHFGFGLRLRSATTQCRGGLFSVGRKYEAIGCSSVKSKINCPFTERTSAIAQQPKSKCGISKSKKTSKIKSKI